MARHLRLTALMQELRAASRPVTAAILASRLSVSERTIYRDIETLRQSGAMIDGAAGLGFVMTEDPALPPQNFTRDEIEALVLGLREVEGVADPALASAARSARSKLRASLPDRLRSHLEHAVLHAKRFRPQLPLSIDPAVLRRAAWDERACQITYRDGAGDKTERTIWPLAIIFLDDVLVVLAWCCLRQSQRSFRLDRISSLTPLTESFRPNRARLLQDALAKEDASRASETVIADTFR